MNTSEMQALCRCLAVLVEVDRITDFAHCPLVSPQSFTSPEESDEEDSTPISRPDRLHSQEGQDQTSCTSSPASPLHFHGEQQQHLGTLELYEHALVTGCLNSTPRQYVCFPVAVANSTTVMNKRCSSKHPVCVSNQSDAGWTPHISHHQSRASSKQLNPSTEKRNMALHTDHILICIRGCSKCLKCKGALDQPTYNAWNVCCIPGTPQLAAKGRWVDQESNPNHAGNSMASNLHPIAETDPRDGHICMCEYPPICGYPNTVVNRGQLGTFFHFDKLPCGCMHYHVSRTLVTVASNSVGDVANVGCSAPQCIYSRISQVNRP